MSVELNHIIIPARDKRASVAFLAGILGLSDGRAWGPFISLPLSNGVALDYVDARDFHQHHCAFLVSDDEFDAALARIRDGGVRFYADPGRSQAGEINHRYGGRGVYFDDPDHHLMEIITQPYGDTPEG